MKLPTTVFLISIVLLSVAFGMSKKKVACTSHGQHVVTPELPSTIAKKFEETKQRAEKGDAAAEGELGWMYRDGYGREQDPSEAIKWMSKSALQGDLGSMMTLAELHTWNDCGLKPNYEESYFWYSVVLPLIQPSLEKQMKEAGSHLTPEQKAEVVKRLQKWEPDYSPTLKLAEQGDKIAMKEVGILYSEHGKEQYYPEAIKWIQKAADQGDEGAAAILAHAYEYAKYGLKQDYAEAYYWKLLAHGSYYPASFEARNNIEEHLTLQQKIPVEERVKEKGDTDAEINIGFQYLFYQKNNTEAVKWYQLAAQKGNVNALLQLAKMYMDDKGGMKDEAEAFKLFQSASDKGSSQAKFFLAGMYINGQGVQKDEAKALDMLLNLANQGEYGPDSRIIDLYLKKQPPNYEEAYFWSVISNNRRCRADLCVGSGNAYNSIKDNLSADKATDIEKRAEEWMKQHSSELHG